MCFVCSHSSFIRGGLPHSSFRLRKTASTTAKRKAQSKKKNVYKKYFCFFFSMLPLISLFFSHTHITVMRGSNLQSVVVTVTRRNNKNSKNWHKGSSNMFLVLLCIAFLLVFVLPMSLKVFSPCCQTFSIFLFSCSPFFEWNLTIESPQVLFFFFLFSLSGFFLFLFPIPMLLLACLRSLWSMNCFLLLLFKEKRKPRHASNVAVLFFFQ